MLGAAVRWGGRVVKGSGLGAPMPECCPLPLELMAVPMSCCWWGLPGWPVASTHTAAGPWRLNMSPPSRPARHTPAAALPLPAPPPSPAATSQSSCRGPWEQREGSERVLKGSPDG